MPGPKTLIEQLRDKFLIGDGCWEWTGAKTRGGYGHLKVKGKNLRAHRVVYEWLVGPIPPGTELDHLCYNVGCVRPDHLQPVTHRENARWIRSSYHPKGPRC